MGWLGFLIGLMVGGTLGVLMVAVLRAGAEFDRRLEEQGTGTRRSDNDSC